jgi:hypothetical protein
MAYRDIYKTNTPPFNRLKEAVLFCKELSIKMNSFLEHSYCFEIKKPAVYGRFFLE